MTGREKIIAALSEQGTASTPVTLCYPDIFLRDHWDEVTSEPWWSGYKMDMGADMEVTRDLQAITGEDRVRLRLGAPRQDRGRYRVETDGSVVRLVDTQTETARMVERPTSEQVSERSRPISINHSVTSREQVDQLLPLGELHTAEELAADGRDELPKRIVAELGKQYMPWVQMPAPFDPLPFCWGFESLMVACLERPDLVEYAAQKVVAHTRCRIAMWKALGVELIWVEDGLTDQMSPDLYRRLMLPYLQELTGVIRRAGMYSIHYYCGEPNDRLDMLLQSGADALSLEESKKTFTIDIMDIAERVDGRMALLGNLDALNLLERGSMDQIRAEVARQLEAGRRNAGRFLMGYGSPITPGTPAARARTVADMVHEMAP